MTDRMAFGKTLREVRERRGLTRKQVAEAVGTTYLNVYFWEKGRHYPSAVFLMKLVALFPEMIKEESGDGKARKKR